MTPQLLLGVEQLIVHFELKCPFTTGNKCKLFDDVLVIAQNIIRHTDGTRCIVSRHAIFKRNCVFILHKNLPPRVKLHCEIAEIGIQLHEAEDAIRGLSNSSIVRCRNLDNNSQVGYDSVRSRACSSAGRALQSHCRGQEFESPQVHCKSDNSSLQFKI